MSEIPETAADVSAPSDVEPEQAQEDFVAADEAGLEGPQAQPEASLEPEPEASLEAEPEASAEAEPEEAEPEAPVQDGFAALGLSEPILRAIDEKGYLHPTPIQAQAIPPC